MEAYAYAAPSSIAEVTALLQEHANDGRPTQILAGGTDVLVQMRSSNRAPRTIRRYKAFGRNQSPRGQSRSDLYRFCCAECAHAGKLSN